VLQVKFLDIPDPDDPVVKSHYRMIRSFTADDPKPLVEGEQGFAARHARLGPWATALPANRGLNFSGCKS
jgi:hypothetical protein